MLASLGYSLLQYLAADKAAKAQERGISSAMEEGRAAYGDVAGMYSPYQEYGPAALAQLAGGDFTTPVEDFQFQGEVSDYLDPSMAYQQEQARRALEQSAVARGGLLSGGTAQALQNQAQQFAMQDYGNAWQRMQNDKNFAYQQFRDRASQRAANAQLRYSQLSQLANFGQGATNAVANARMGQATNQANLLTQLGTQQAARAAAPYMAGSQALQNYEQMAMGALNAYAQGQGVAK